MVISALFSHRISFYPSFRRLNYFYWFVKYFGVEKSTQYIMIKSNFLLECQLNARFHCVTKCATMCKHSRLRDKRRQSVTITLIAGDLDSALFAPSAGLGRGCRVYWLWCIMSVMVNVGIETKWLKIYNFKLFVEMLSFYGRICFSSFNTA